MQTLQGSTLQSLVAVQRFLDTNASKLATVVTTGARQKLDDVVMALGGHATAQSGNTFAAQGATLKHRSLRQTLLRDHMAPIARIAAAELPLIPEVLPLKMPRGRPSVARLAILANGMAEAAVPFTTVFTQAGLPADFVARLTAASDATLASIGDHTQIKGARGGATKGIKTTLSSGRRIVHVLDAFVKTALADDPALLANWNQIKRVQRSGSRAVTPVTPAPTPTPGPTPTPTPAATA